MAKLSPSAIRHKKSIKNSNLKINLTPKYKVSSLDLLVKLMENRW